MKALNNLSKLIPIVIALVALSEMMTGSAVAQSTDRDHPTPLTSNEVRGTGSGKQKEYYYSFTGGPGEITVTVDGATKITYGGAAYVELFDRNAEPILSVNVGNTGGRTERKVERVQLNRRQMILMKVTTSDSTVRYLVRVEGPVEFDHAVAATTKAAADGRLDCLPERGILRIEMNDGTMQEINLSRVRRISVKP